MSLASGKNTLKGTVGGRYVREEAMTVAYKGESNGR